MRWFMVLVGLLVLVGFVLLLVALQVEDWSRDLTTNSAALDEQSVDVTLRPLELPELLPVVSRAIDEALPSLPRWQVVEKKQGTGFVEWRATRTTPLLRFVDDILVRAESHDFGTRVTAESRSRVGRGDLGQNPRNLRELRAGIERRLVERAVKAQ